MFPHEKYLKSAIECCKITKVVQDLGAMYVTIVNKCGTDEEMEIALKVDRILKSAAKEIADLGPKLI